MIVLLKSGLAELLPELYSEVIVPEAVWDEILAGSEDDAARLSLPLLDWITRTSVDITNHTLRDQGLGRGEVEAITIALEGANTKLLADDLLVLAKKKGLIPSVSQALSEVQKTGLWLDHDLIELLQRKAGE